MDPTFAQEVPAISVELSADPTVNYAVQQNAVSVIKRLRVTNGGTVDLDHITVAITTEPSFAHPWEYILERIPAGSTCDLGAVDIPLSHDFLAQQAEAVRGSICVAVRRGGELLSEHRTPIDVLAYDEWNGRRAIPEILAAFVLPNHPNVEDLLRRAGEMLATWTGSPSFKGYQTKNVEDVRLQVAAIYATIQQQHIQYCGVPASFEQDGQKIRTPDRVLNTHLGNCLDLSTLVAACLEQAGLRPLICLIPGHAFPGVWLTEESFTDTVVDDALMLRKRMDLGEIELLEPTLAVAGSASDIKAALAAGRRHLDDPGNFYYCVDIHRARMGRIRPLPVRQTKGAGPDADGQKDSAAFDTRPPVEVGGAPQVPVSPHPEPALPPAPAEKALTPAARLERWKRKLLDLSLRNRLLNFQETRAAVPLLCPDLPALEIALAEGKQLELHPRPLDWQRSERDSNLHLRRTGEDAETALLLEEFAHRRLRCDLEPSELNRRLTELYRAARTSIEENGANTLYLALGMLVWYETKTSTQSRRAPILLIPIEIQRRSAQSGFTVRLRDEEAMVNVTLLELLRHDFDLTIPGLDPLPEGEAGIDVRLVLDRVRQAVKHIERWDVAESAHVGLFSFTKFLMWRDLEVRTDDLKRNKLVSSLIHFPTQPFPAAGRFPAVDRLDDDYRLAETYSPISADSSQLAAVYAAGEGKSFVLHGPPGTGKSQTITNIIAHALGQGKTVLFVAEKMAALSVVQRRLEAAGLGPFCLELHSNKSKKTDVLAQLDASMKVAQVKEPAEWEVLADRLAQARAKLNGYVRTLHRPRQTGESFYAGLANLVGLGNGPKVTFAPRLLAETTRGDLDRLRDQVRLLAAAGRAAGHPARHVWRAARTAEWTPQLRDQVDAAIGHLREAVQACAERAKPVATLLGLPDSEWNWNELSALKSLSELILARSTFVPALVEVTGWDEVNAAVEQWIRHGTERDRLRGLAYARYTDGVLQLDLDDLAARRAAVAQGWFLPRWLTQRRVLKVLQTAAKPGHRVSAADIDSDIEVGRQLRQEERTVAAAGDQARALLGRLWRDGEADWADIAAASAWAASVRRVAAQVAGEDPLRAQELRRRWGALMAEQAESLRTGGVYAARLQQYVQAVGALVDGRDRLASLLTLDEVAAFGDSHQRRYCEHVTDVLTDWQNHLGQLRLWCAWIQERNAALGLKLGAIVQAYEQGQVDTEDLGQVFERSFYGGWVDQILGEEEELRRFSRQSQEDRIAHFRTLDDQFSDLTRQHLRARLSARIPRYEGEPSPSSEVGILRGQLQRRTRHMALRALFQNIRNLLPRLKPCLLMSPISVAQYLDPSFPPFDLVVFDEASQVPTWDAVGAIARGAETIIVGDPQQLPPTNFFTRTDGAEEEEVATEDLESILDDSLALTMPELHLRWHYRSRHESLIAFSNYHYYESGLLSFPSPMDRSAVNLRHVPGEYDRGRSTTNRAEAEAVVLEVVRRLRNPETAGQSLGIVTFNSYQQLLVEDLLDEARRQHPEIEPYFNHELAEPVFVKNLENVQGDERDVILFTVCYGPDRQGWVSANFGQLNREGGHRRLNVAITRARQEVVVFTSLRPEQIDLSRTRAKGVHHLKAFLEYAERGMPALKERVQFAAAREGETTALDQQVYEVLTARGHRVQKQVGCSGYRIDLAIEDPSTPGRFLLGIECDGKTYQEANTTRDRDKLREAVLRELGWGLHRIWAIDWWQDCEREIERLEAAIEAARTAAVRPAGRTEPEHPAVAIPVVQGAQQPLPASPALAASDDRPVEGGTPALPPYRVSGACPPQAAMQLDFFAPATAPYVQRLIAEIVQEEGPLSLGLLCQRVAPFWSISRVTARVEQRIADLARKSGVKRITHGTETFVWPAQVDPATFDSFRIGGGDEKARRTPGDLPPEEIANAALYVLRGQVSLPVEELVREVAHLFGYQRIGPNVDRCLRVGIELLVRRGGAVEQDGAVVVRTA